MKDRVPALGKANRVKITQDNGQIVEGGLSYADEAIEEGSAYCKANVLPDDVCDVLGLDREMAEPKDAFLTLYAPPMNYCRLVLTVTMPDGTPIANRKVEGLSDIEAGKCFTDANGVLDLYVSKTSYTLSMPQYADANYIDITFPNLTVQTPMGQTVRKAWTAQFVAVNRMEIKTSQQIAFSPMVESVDVFCVGGGGGGASSYKFKRAFQGGGGGGGYVATQLNAAFSPGISYQAMVGSGGAATPSVDGVTSYCYGGNAGGSTSFLGITANGGRGAPCNDGAARSMGGAGGSGGGGAAGNGGSDGSNGTGWSDSGGAGSNATTRAFGEASGAIYAGGGGGGGNDIGGSGGQGGGGKGAAWLNAPSAGAGKPNTGGGGGGGAPQGHGDPTAGAAGGSGIIIIRWRHKA